MPQGEKRGFAFILGVVRELKNEGQETLSQVVTIKKGLY
jgi:hypothetical protein